MNAKISVFAICTEAIIYWLLNNFHSCTFNWKIDLIYLLWKLPRSAFNSRVYFMKVFADRKNLEFCKNTNATKIFRSSQQRCSIENSVLRNFAKFTEKHLCQSLFLIKLQAWQNTSGWLLIDIECIKQFP